MNTLHKLTDWYFSKRAMPYWCVLILDCCIVLFSGIVGTYLHLGGAILASSFWPHTYALIALIPIYCICFHIFHTYNGVARFSSYVDFYRISSANLFGSLAAGLLGTLVHTDAIIFPDWVIALSLFFIGTMLMWIVRMMVKAAFESFNISNAEPVAIYGTKAGGVALANNIGSVRDKKYVLKAFISDGQEMKDSYLLGKRVYLNGEGIADTLTNIGVKTLLVSPLKTEKFRNNEAMVDSITNAGIKIMMMPAAEEWDGKGELTLNQLHEVEIEDLLPREPIQVDMDAIGSMLTGKRVLITGAAGSIGSEMVRQIAPYKPADLILIDQAETPMHDMRLWASKVLNGTEKNVVFTIGDMTIVTIVTSITDKAHMEKIFSDHRPEYVFHAAAYKHVPMMEDNPAQAVRNNINGTRIIADLAVKYGTKKFVMISTDKAVNPTNVMGCSKRICEIYCQSLNQAIQNGTCPIKPVNSDGTEGSFPTGESGDRGCQSLNQAIQNGTCPIKPVNSDGTEGSFPKGESGDRGCQFVTTRFGNVLGSNGSVIPIFKDQIKKGGPITVTHPDIIRFFMLIPEACKLVLEAGTMGKGGEIFVFDMGKPVRIVDLAKRIIHLSGATNIEIKFTGLRDGEKLYEEVLNDAEGTKPTVHPKIKVAKVREYDYETACQNEQRLLQASESFDDMEIVKIMKEIVPEFKSRVSKYEVLDK